METDYPKLRIIKLHIEMINSFQTTNILITKTFSTFYVDNQKEIWLTKKMTKFTD